jgi:Rps23 Pro-64 3,4-dihydroxylase Tpa1-like proline 4-hydroxylase
VAHYPSCQCALCQTENFFDSAGFRALVHDITGTSLGGVQDFFASWYQPGDFLTQHHDHGVERSVAVLFGFTKNWSPVFGGNLHFLQPFDKIFYPSFNSLVLFDVKLNPEHFVEEVVAGAKPKRLTVTGWFMNPSAPQPQEQQQQATTKSTTHY